jgi:hypothetical protein
LKSAAFPVTPPTGVTIYVPEASAFNNARSADDFAGRAIEKPSETKHDKEYSMKLNRIITMCAVALALAMSIGDAFAQINAGGGNGGGGFNNGGGFGGGRRNRGGNGGNFDPAQMQQRRLDMIRQQLDFTNDTDWAAVQPLVQKVLDAQQAVRQGGGRGMFGGGRRGGNGGPNGNNFGNPNGGGRGGRGGFGPQPSPEAQALQQAVDNDAPADQINDLLAKYNASEKAKQAALAAAQANLRQVLTVKQEAQATLMGLL